MRRVRRSALAWRAVEVFGRLALGAGVLLLLFAAYLTWGTRWQEARAQDRLRREFAVVVADAPAPSTPAPARVQHPTASSSTTTTTTTPAPPPALGEPVAILRIPRFGVDKVVVEGAGTDQLRLGPGHYSTTPLPGRAGNVAIAGHRTTYGAPFRRLDELRPGDEILLTTPAREVRYLVTGSAVVSPDAVGVLAPAGDDRLTLTTCDPPYSARSRLVVTAAVDGDPWPPPVVERPVTRAPLRSVIPPEQIVTVRTTVVPAPAPLPVTHDGGSPLAWSVIWPAVTTTLLAAGVWWIARRSGRRWLALPGAAPVLVSLALFFDRLAAALPPEV